MSTFINGGIDNNWSTSGNWSAGVPTSADTAVFDASSPNCIVDIAGVCISLDFTGYTNTITMTNGITVSGSVTLVAAMTIAGSGNLTINATGTITPNGKTFPNSLILSGGTVTTTLASNFTVTGSLTFSATSNRLSGAFTLSVGGSISTISNTILQTSTPTLRMNGTGSISGVFAPNITFDTIGTITVTGSFSPVAGCVLTYIAGTIITTGSTLSNVNTNCTINTGAITAEMPSGVIWNTVTLSGGAIFVTLTSPLNVGGTLTLGNLTNTTTINGSQINAYGNVTTAGTTALISGSTTITIKSTCTLSTVSSTFISTNLVFDSGASTVSIGNLRYSNGAMVYTSGNVVHTGSLTCGTNAGTYSTSGIIWNNVSWTSTTACTLLQDFNCNGTFNTGSAVTTTTYNGPGFFFNCRNLTITITTGILTGSAGFNMAYDGALTMTNVTTGYMTNNLKFSTTTLFNGPLNYRTGTVTNNGGTLSTTTTSAFNITGAATLNTTGLTFPTVNHITASTLTLTGDLRATTLTIGATTLATVIDGAGTWGGASVILNVTSGTITGAAKLSLTNTDTLTMPLVTSGSLQNNVEFTSGTPVVSGLINYRTGTWFYVAGTPATTGSTLSLIAASTLSSAGMTWSNITIGSGLTITQGSNNAFSGTLTTAGTTTINGLFTLTGFNWEAGTTTLSGNSTVTFSGGTSVLPNTINGTALTVNKTNTLTFAGVTNWTIPTFTNTSGALGTGTLTIAGNRTFNGATTWGGWNVSGSPTVTLNALQTLTGLLNATTCIFAGSAGWTASDFMVLSMGSTITLQQAITYTVTDHFSATGTLGNVVLLKSSDATHVVKAIFTVNVGAEQSSFYADATDIDSSAGQTVNSTNGTFSNTLNWLNVSSLATSYSWVN